MKLKNNQSPRFCRSILMLLLNVLHPETVVADYDEIFTELVEEKGRLSASMWYWGQIITIIPSCVKSTLYWSCIMFSNYLKLTLRNISKQKSYSLINVLGLALGMTLCILIFRWAQYEKSVDTFHEKRENLYLIRTWQTYGEQKYLGSGSVPALGPALKTEFPEVIDAVRMQNGQNEVLLQFGEKKLKQDWKLTDPTIFDIFTYPFIKGDPNETKNDPRVLVLSESLSNKFFEDEDPIGKIVTVDNAHDFRVVGVMKDIPDNATLDFDLWAPIQVLTDLYRQNYLDTWYNLAFRTYLEMTPGFDLQAFNEKIKERIRESNPETNSEPLVYPYKDIYMKIWGREGQLYTFGTIALFVLIIACINFMNLSTARATRRAKEVGLRKVVGARKSQLIRQFFGESFLTTLFALAFSVLFAELFLPLFRDLTSQPIQSIFKAEWLFWGAALGIALITGLLAGAYPALFLSSFKIIRVLRDKTLVGLKGGLFRKVLVVVQFTLSIILIVGTTVIYNQTNFMKNKELGFEKDQLITMRVEGDLKNNYQSMKNALLQNPNISHVSVSSHSVVGIYWNGQDWEWQGRDENVNPLVTYVSGDSDMMETLQLEITEGRYFRPSAEGIEGECVINEEFARIIGGESALGITLSQGEYSAQVIGVVEDFHYKPVYTGIGPIMIFNDMSNPRRLNYMYIRISPNNMHETLQFIEQQATVFNPEFPFEYRFIDEQLNRMYRFAERMMKTVRIFAVFAIFISCLGLLGLAAFMAEQRTKEIGVRKVMGAPISRIILLLSTDFTKLVLISNVVAWPVAYWVMNMWLQEFAYRTSVSIMVLIQSALAALLIAWLTVAYQSFRAARANPVDALRYE